MGLVEPEQLLAAGVARTLLDLGQVEGLGQLVQLEDLQQTIRRSGKGTTTQIC